MNRSWMFAAAALVAVGPIRAQDAPQPKRGAVVVEGVVRGVFRDVKPERPELVVQIDVARAELGPQAADSRRSAIPAPGDPAYVHVTASPPAEGSSIRAYLAPRPGGGWQGASPEWFERLDDPRGRGDDLDPAAPPRGPASGKTVLGRFGVKADPVETSGRLVLKITEVLPGTPAQKAGFEKGDVVIGVNKSGFASLQQFADLLSQGPPMAEFALLNVRTNEQATVEVDVADIIKDGPPRRPMPSPTAPSPAPTSPKRSLGAELEPVRQGRRPGLKVTAVLPNSPARKAGFEVGDVLVSAGGDPLPDEASLQKAVDKAGDSLTVVVLDSRTGNDVPVEVPLGPPSAGPKPAPSPTPTPTPSPEPTAPGGGVTSRSFGLTVKPGTADLLPVVKVTAVAPGSPAAKAGLEVGDAIVGVDDRVVFAPDLFEEALKSVGPSFTLTVLDVKSGKKTPVKVDLGR
ncbi:PDZ domain-containing protein [Paludisphaera soli]|uniref:PDZ domain-containing protein n=1 Tax=Paludisphaera soli TaxID=2712865 RepID=UPI0013E9D3D6|nr:PDZ domain-containing protein [Paludisphaera soli]